VSDDGARRPFAAIDARLRRAAAGAALVALAVVAVATVNERALGREAADAAAADAARGDWAGSVAHARAAAEAHAPGSPWPDEGFRRLDAIGHDAVVRGDAATALLAYGAMQGAAATAVTGLARPLLGLGADDTWRARAEDGLARLSQASRASRPAGAAP
jgi:hypothetical protein